MLDESKLEHLKQLIEVQTELQYMHEGYTNLIHAPSYRVQIRPGIKCTKVDIGCSGRYMIDNASGRIFGIKAYGVIHRGHTYGTLDTVDSFNWGGYVAVERQP